MMGQARSYKRLLLEVGLYLHHGADHTEAYSYGTAHCCKDYTSLHIGMPGQ